MLFVQTERLSSSKCEGHVRCESKRRKFEERENRVGRGRDYFCVTDFEKQEIHKQSKHPPNGKTRNEFEIFGSVAFKILFISKFSNKIARRKKVKMLNSKDSITFIMHPGVDAECAWGYGHTASRSSNTFHALRK